MKDERPSVARNKKAWRDYKILDKLEVGIQLKGSEVKSLREAHVSISDAYVRVENGELFLLNAHITPYSKINTFEALKPTRKRKLLAHKAQIKRLIASQNARATRSCRSAFISMTAAGRNARSRSPPARNNTINANP